tara:strand:+ start:9968 stop:10915 length:948 start_codon:yes stop_codon:yes gene_type:complete
MSNKKSKSLLDNNWQIGEVRDDGYFNVWEREIKGKRGRTEILVTPVSEVFTWLKKADVLMFADYIEMQLKKLPLFEFVDESSEQEFKRYKKLYKSTSRFFSSNKSISRKPSEEKANDLIESWISFLCDFYSHDNFMLRRRFYKYIAAQEKRRQHERVVNNSHYNDLSRQHKRGNQINLQPSVRDKTSVYTQVAKLKKSPPSKLLCRKIEYDRGHQTLFLAPKHSRQISMRFYDLSKFEVYFSKPRVIKSLSPEEKAALEIHRSLASKIIQLVEADIANEELALTWIELYKHWGQHKRRYRKVLDDIKNNAKHYDI